MKRRNIILTFAIIALLLIGVGYAALTDTLTVNGDISTSKAELVLQFNGESKVVSGDAEVTVTDGSVSADVDFKNLKQAGDKVVVTLEFVNRSAVEDLKAISLSAAIKNKDNDNEYESTYFTVETGIVVGQTAASAGNPLLVNNAESIATLTITVTLNKSITADTPVEESFRVIVTGQTA